MLALDAAGRTGNDMLAAVYEQMGERDQAAETYSRIVELSPNDADAWEHLGTWRALQGNTNDAIAAYNRSLELDPDRITARFSLAETYLEAERFEEAMNAYQALVQQGEELQSDDLAAAYAGLADTYNSLERYDDAIATAKHCWNSLRMTLRGITS